LTQESRTSSFSNISHGDAPTPGEFPGDSQGSLTAIGHQNASKEEEEASSPIFKALYDQAMALVEKESMIMPFTSPSGHLHLLRSLAPETVYLQESLCGEEGEIAERLSGWVKQTVVVVGAEGGHGGLVDTDDEDGLNKSNPSKWWQKEDRTGLGKGLAVVDSFKVGEDWQRRIAEAE
jgi:hypothetical protein